MGVVDGNNLLKWMVTTGGQMQASNQVFENSEYYLSKEFVNQYEMKLPPALPIVLKMMMAMKTGSIPLDKVIPLKVLNQKVH